MTSRAPPIERDSWLAGN